MGIGSMLQADGLEFDRIEEEVRLAKALRSFSRKMSDKLTNHIGRGGWSEEENAADMFEALEDALKEGDYISVANYSMFLDALGYKPKR